MSSQFYLEIGMRVANFLEGLHHAVPKHRVVALKVVVVPAESAPDHLHTSRN
jgi:hypothetical protein